MLFLGKSLIPMAADAFASSNGQNQVSYKLSHPNIMSPNHQSQNPFDTDLGLSSLRISPERANSRTDVDAVSAIRMRKLPRHTTQEGLRTMLLFAKDFIGADFVSPDAPEDQGYLTAIARFRSAGAAHEVQALLSGKQNNSSEAPMIVDILRLSPNGNGQGSRNHFELADHRANSNSSATSSTGQPRQSLRFNGAFQSMDRMSPPNGARGFNPGNNNEGTDVVSPRSNFFSPKSPVEQRQRMSGKAVIGEDGADEEPSELLKDPIGYANGDHQAALSRRSTNNGPMPRYAPLSLSTANNPTSPPPPPPPPPSGFSTPRAAGGPLQSPTGPMSPTAMPGFAPNGTFQMGNPQFPRHTYPPVNPADQNPPCNTLYVGNLPIDTSEDELKAMFSKQRGYKRLCFRTKQNGPMCFVEFEDISFATKALNELYGHPLHNSVKGGIRLSFSKNPLGVRTGQPGGMGPTSPMSPTGTAGLPVMNGMGVFTTANGPPPGLSAPPGLANNGTPLANHGHPVTTSQGPLPNMGGPNGMMSPISGMPYGAGDMGLGMNGMRGPAGPSGPVGTLNNGVWGGQGPGGYSDYMYR